mgnify:CR=1 FL=1
MSQPMPAATRLFHGTILRALKMIVSAYDDWLKHANKLDCEPERLHDGVPESRESTKLSAFR